MTRTDIIAIALWLIAIPANRWLGDVGSVLCGLLGLACLVWGRLHKDEIKADSVLGLQNIAPPAPIKKHVGPNLRCVEVKSTSLMLTPNTALENSQGVFAVAATILNHPTESGARIVEGVRAFLEFKKQGVEVCSGNGAWINVPQNYVTLRSGEKARLVLAMLEESTVYALTNSRNVPLPRIRYSNVEQAMLAREQQTLSKYALNDDALDIKATMTDIGGQWCGTFTFKYEWKDGNVVITQIP